MLHLDFHCIDANFFRPTGHYVRDFTLFYRTLHLFIILLLYVLSKNPGHTYRGFDSVFLDHGMTAFPIEGLARHMEVPIMAASIPGTKVVEEYWNCGQDGQLEAVAGNIHMEVVAASIHLEAAMAATLKHMRLRETLPTASRVLDPYENTVI
jgi:hypothetical protein